MQNDKTTPSPTPSPKTSPNTGKVADNKHKAKHPERQIPASQPSERAEILPATHVVDDPESYRLT